MRFGLGGSEYEIDLSRKNWHVARLSSLAYEPAVTTARGRPRWRSTPRCPRDRPGSTTSALARRRLGGRPPPGCRRSGPRPGHAGRRCRCACGCAAGAGHPFAGTQSRASARRVEQVIVADLAVAEQRAPARQSADRYWFDRVTGYPALAAQSVLHPGPAAGVVADQHREQFADGCGQLCGVVRREHDGGP